MLKKLMLIITLLFVAQGFAAPIQAAVIYDNDRGVIEGARAITYCVPADDFTLTEDSIINSAKISLYGLTLADWDTSGEWGIFSDSSQKPGALLASGNTFNNQLTGVPRHFDLYFDFGQNFNAVANTTYWFAFHALEAGSSPTVGWAGTVGVAGNVSTGVSYLDYIDQGYGDASDFFQPIIGDLNNCDLWSPATVDLAFQLYGPESVPEPTTMFLLGLGLIGLAGVRRKF